MVRPKAMAMCDRRTRRVHNHKMRQLTDLISSITHHDFDGEFTMPATNFQRKAS